MVTLCVLCPDCGNRVEETVDEYYPPGWLHCECGAKFSLTMDEEVPEEAFPEALGDEDDVPDKDELADLTEIELFPEGTDAAA